MFLASKSIDLRALVSGNEAANRATKGECVRATEPVENEWLREENSHDTKRPTPGRSDGRAMEGRHDVRDRTQADRWQGVFRPRGHGADRIRQDPTIRIVVRKERRLSAQTNGPARGLSEESETNAPGREICLSP